MRGPRRPLYLVLVVLLTAFFPLGLGQLGPAGARPAEAAGGRLLLPRGFKLLLVDPSNGAEQPLYSTNQLLLSAAWSPDGRRVAFAQFSRRPGDRYGGSELYVLDGDQAAQVVDRTERDESLNAPSWAADGQALVYQVTSSLTTGFTIEQARLGSPNRQTLETNAGSPTVSPDGSLLAFVRLAGSERLIVRPLAGGPETELAPPNAFAALASPRFSPDGRRIAFFGIGGPPSGRLRPAPAGLAALRFDLGRALAHGIPWDPWVVDVDGGGLHQVASMSEDDPTLVWAPDGSALGVLGGGGLWIVPLDGGAPALISTGSYGVMDWRP